MISAHASTDNTPLSEPSHAAEIAALREEIAELKRQLAWFRQHLFGSKSEQRPVGIPVAQLPLFAPAATPVAAPDGESITVTYQRGKAPKLRPDDCVNDSGLRFSADVPVKVIHLTPPELQGEEADQYEVIGTHRTFRVAQRPASYLILQYERPSSNARAASSRFPALHLPTCWNVVSPMSVSWWGCWWTSSSITCPCTASTNA